MLMAAQRLTQPNLFADSYLGRYLAVPDLPCVAV